MRKISFVLSILIVFGALSAPAEQLRRERDQQGTLQRLVRAVRSILRPQTNGDVLIPPTPAPQPRP
ncbi:MAG TPA: hypothetical protein VGD79_06440 [Thermoanaerobaculia bacterium]|jgi:hypothetical protein